jgi:hypothetical protein
MVNTCQRITFEEPFLYGVGQPTVALNDAQYIVFNGGQYGTANVTWGNTALVEFTGRDNGSGGQSSLHLIAKGGSQQWHEGTKVDFLNVSGANAQPFLVNLRSTYKNSQYIIRAANEIGDEIWAVKGDGLIPQVTKFGNNVHAVTIFPCDANGNITDNTGALGNDAHRWNYIRGVTVAQGDSVFDNDMRITESEKLGYEKGLAFLDARKRPLMILTNQGELYIAGKVNEGLPPSNPSTSKTSEK